MGVERSVTLWHLHRQMLLQELASLDAQLSPVPTTSNPDSLPLVPTIPQPTNQNDLETQRKTTQEKLRALGPCPKPMMG